MPEGYATTTRRRVIGFAGNHTVIPDAAKRRSGIHPRAKLVKVSALRWIPSQARDDEAACRGTSAGAVSVCRWHRPEPQSWTPAGMSASVTPTDSMFLMMTLRISPSPRLNSSQVLT